MGERRRDDDLAHARILAPYTGLFRLAGSDLLCARINGSLFLITPDDPAPLANALRLEPRGKHTFLIADGDDFGFLGEHVTFGVTRQGAVEIGQPRREPLPARRSLEVVARVDVDARHAFADVHRVVLRIVVERESHVEPFVEELALASRA